MRAGRDYHDVIKGKLKELANKLGARGRDLGLEFDAKVFVDTAPVMEKPLAERGGIGWQGKHTNLVSRQHGSWLFLSEIFLDIALAPDEPEIDHCGSCRACLDACPTAAFPAPYQLDARRCISYLTIEHAGPIPLEFRTAIGNRIYGCDDCLAVCPWNKFANVGRDMKLAARDDLKRPALADLVKLDDAAFRTFFSGSPIKRIGPGPVRPQCPDRNREFGRRRIAPASSAITRRRCTGRARCCCVGTSAIGWGERFCRSSSSPFRS